MKTYRFAVTHTEHGYIDITAEDDRQAREKAEEAGCAGMEVNKCRTDIEKITEVI